MGTSVSPRLPPSCRSLLARLQINASRTLCALHPILPTSFANTASSLSCLRIVLPTPENRSVRSARNRSDTREPTKSPTLTSAHPGPHVEDNLVPPVAAPAPGSIPDYPPPSFDEAIAAAAADKNASPVSPAGSTTTHSSPDRPQPAPILIPPVPRTQNQPVVTRTPPDSSELSESVRYSTQAECDSDSDDGDLEVISTSDATSPTTSSEQDSPSGDTMRPSPSQLTLGPHLNGMSQGVDDRSIISPSNDSQVGDSLIGPRHTT